MTPELLGLRWNCWRFHFDFCLFSVPGINHSSDICLWFNRSSRQQSSNYHSGNRGAKSVYLLDLQSPTNSIPDDALHFDLLTNSVSVVLLLYSHKNSWQADLIHVTHAKIINKLVDLWVIRLLGFCFWSGLQTLLSILHGKNWGLMSSGFVSTINIIITTAYGFNRSLNKNVDVNLHYDGLTGAYAIPEV